MKEAARDFMASWDSHENDGMISLQEFEDHYKGERKDYFRERQGKIKEKVSGDKGERFDFMSLKEISRIRLDRIEFPSI